MWEWGGRAGRATIGIAMLVYSSLPVIAGDWNAQNRTVPSFLGADGVRALEEAQAAINRDADAARSRETEAKAQRRREAEAEAKRRAEEVRRVEDIRRQMTPESPAKAVARIDPGLTDEEKAAKKRADERFQAFHNNVTVMPMTVAPSGSPTATEHQAKPCSGPAAVSGVPLSAGQVRVSIASPCRKGETFQISYGGAAFQRILDATGKADVVFDMYLGRQEPIAVVFADSSHSEVAVQPRDLDKVSKIAVLWSAPVNLDLHAFGHAAAYGDPEHVWSGAPWKAKSAVREAVESGKGHGFLSLADDGNGPGLKAEVYTFVHSDDEAQGTVAMALDYASRGNVPDGEMCGEGRLASVDYEVIVLGRDGSVSRESGRIAGAPCGTALAEPARYRRSVVPDLKIRK